MTCLYSKNNNNKTNNKTKKTQGSSAKNLCSGSNMA